MFVFFGKHLSRVLIAFKDCFEYVRLNCSYSIRNFYFQNEIPVDGNF